MKYFKRGPLVFLLAVSIVIFGIVTGVPKLLAFAQAQMVRGNLQVETLPEYTGPEYDVSGNLISEGAVSDNDVSGSDVSGSDMPVSNVSGNDVPEITVSGSEEPPVSGNEVAAPGFSQVDADYFSDALFIGDSRTVGLYEYSGMEQATFYASTGLTVYKVFDAKIVPIEGSRNKITVEEALQQKQFGKIYFMIGINEMGRGTVDTFMEEYQKVVAHLQELQPDAMIYVQAIMRVSTERSDKGDYINNEGINARNERIAQLADNEKIFYLDVNPLICDETGGMVKEYTFDGVHLKAEYIPIWTDFLSANAIVR